MALPKHLPGTHCIPQPELHSRSMPGLPNAAAVPNSDQVFPRTRPGPGQQKRIVRRKGERATNMASNADALSKPTAKGLPHCGSDHPSFTVVSINSTLRLYCASKKAISLLPNASPGCGGTRNLAPLFLRRGTSTFRSSQRKHR
jgi:hypothetical protein